GVATTTPTFTDFPLGVKSGTYDHTFELGLASSYNSAFIAANGGTVITASNALFAGLDAGRAYLNIHKGYPLSSTDHDMLWSHSAGRVIRHYAWPMVGLSG